MANRRLYPFWSRLTTALRTGLPQNETRDGSPNPFAAPYAEPAQLKQFLKAMTGVSHSANLAIAHKFPWNKYRTAVDVGTAQGDLITQVALANPHIEGTGFDLPEVEPIFEEYVAANRISGRVKFSPGSFMGEPLPAAEVIMMGHILHDWSLEKTGIFVLKASEALPSGRSLDGSFRPIDDDHSENSLGLLVSYNSLIENRRTGPPTGADCPDG